MRNLKARAEISSGWPKAYAAPGSSEMMQAIEDRTYGGPSRASDTALDLCSGDFAAVAFWLEDGPFVDLTTARRRASPIAFRAAADPARSLFGVDSQHGLRHIFASPPLRPCSQRLFVASHGRIAAGAGQLNQRLE